MTDHRTLITQLCAELDHNRRCLLDDRRVTHPLADRVRAVLARWGQQPAPPAEGDVGELVADLRGTARGLESQAYPHTAALINRAADLLEQRHPTPVPVSERLPGPEDCDGDGLCWWLIEPYPRPVGPGGKLWSLSRYCPGSTHWLPAHALPLPAVEEIDG